MRFSGKSSQTQNFISKIQKFSICSKLEKIENMKNGENRMLHWTKSAYSWDYKLWKFTSLGRFFQTPQKTARDNLNTEQAGNGPSRRQKPRLKNSKRTSKCQVQMNLSIRKCSISKIHLLASFISSPGFYPLKPFA